MKTILLIENSVELNQLLISLIEASGLYKVIPYTQAALALDFIKNSANNPQAYDLVLSDFHLDGINADSIYSALRKISSTIPFILHTSEDLLHLGEFRKFVNETPGNGYLSKPASESDLMVQIKKSLAATLVKQPELNAQVNITASSNNDFYCFPISLAVRFNQSPVDFYIRLSDIKYIKIVNENDSNIANILNKYIDRNVSSVYCAQIQCPKLYQALWNQYSRISEDQVLPTSGKMWSLVQTWFKIIGLQLQQLHLSQAFIDQNIKDVNILLGQLDDEKYFSKHFKDIEKTSGLIFGHSLLTAWIIHTISPQISWMTPAMKKKLIACAILHNLYMQESEFDHEWIFPQSANIELHIQKAVNGLDPNNNNSLDMAKIIKNHHVNITGKNSANLEQIKNLDVLSLLFNCCHELAVSFLRHGFEQELIANFLTDLSSKSQLKTLNEIESILQKTFCKKSQTHTS